MVEEQWKPIIGYESRYLISNYGRVMSLGRTMIARDGHLRCYPNRLLKPKPHKKRGYVSVRLFQTDWQKWKHVEIHRLVALHFISNPENFKIVNHLDEKRSNNNFKNLEWTTVSGNVTHNDAHIKAGKSRRKTVYQYTQEGELVNIWEWAPDAEIHGYNTGMIRKVCLQYRKTYKGFLWSYSRL